MSIINKTIISVILIFFPFSLMAEEIKKVGKFKDWETMVLTKSDGIVCFAQSKPVLQSPKTSKRDSRLFVTFRPSENIKDEVSLTSGHDYKTSTVTAASGKNKLKRVRFTCLSSTST